MSVFSSFFVACYFLALFGIPFCALLDRSTTIKKKRHNAKLVIRVPRVRTSPWAGSYGLKRITYERVHAIYRKRVDDPATQEEGDTDSDATESSAITTMTNDNNSVMGTHSLQHLTLDQTQSFFFCFPPEVIHQ